MTESGTIISENWTIFSAVLLIILGLFFAIQKMLSFLRQLDQKNHSGDIPAVGDFVKVIPTSSGEAKYLYGFFGLIIRIDGQQIELQCVDVNKNGQAVSAGTLTCAIKQYAILVKSNVSPIGRIKKSMADWILEQRKTEQKGAPQCH